MASELTHFPEVCDGKGACQVLTAFPHSQGVGACPPGDRKDKLWTIWENEVGTENESSWFLTILNTLKKPINSVSWLLYLRGKICGCFGVTGY